MIKPNNIERDKTKQLIVVGGGLAGSEAAWQAAKRGVQVFLYEMRPVKQTGAHVSSYLAELVCSNSLGSNLVGRAGGLLKEELRKLGSLLVQIAEDNTVPAGSALAVDRNSFAKRVTEAIENHPNITVVRSELTGIPKEPTIIATGPLTSERFSRAIMSLTGTEHLYFFDAIAPIVYRDSINMEVAFRASRYKRGVIDDGDYINCPFNREEYEHFVNELIKAERIELKKFEQHLTHGVKAGMHKYFEGCLPIEIMAQRGKESLAFGPLRPVGLIDPRTGKRPYAVVQLRQDNLAGDLFNMVGFQTNLKFPEQRRIFRLIPGLENATFERYGQMHRNTFIFSPSFLYSTMQFTKRADLFFAGQITGVEGYVGNIATGLLAGINAANFLNNIPLMSFPRTTMIGALCYYITHADQRDFQPMKANFGILPPLEGEKIRGKRQRGIAHAERAIEDLDNYLKRIAYS